MRKWIAITVGVAIAAVAGLVLSARNMINDVTTGETAAYPDIQPQRFETDFDRVFHEAVSAAQSIGIEITEKDPATGVIRGVATTRILRFKDDVMISLVRDGGSVVVKIRSASRVGKSDFGMNAKRIRTIQAALSERLN
jgi:uncharacterized protein (DUF1499 family)